MGRLPSRVVFVFVISIAIQNPIQAKGIGSGLSETVPLDANEPKFESDPEIEKTFYVGSFFKATWHTASKYCRHRGMQLASINNEKEQHKLEATLDKYGILDLEYVWISGTNSNETNVYVWNNSRTRTPMTYTKWHKGEPTSPGNSENCVRVHQKEGGYGWENYGCNSNFYFVCEISDFNSYTNFCLNKHFA